MSSEIWGMAVGLYNKQIEQLGQDLGDQSENHLSHQLAVISSQRLSFLLHYEWG